jgi:coiled-coil domain-containing protein 130
VVTSGARQKEEDWDPEDNGGYAVHDTDPSKPPLDALAALEKSATAEAHQTTVVQPRIESLQSLSEHYNSDPYSLSRKVRKKFREEKKVETEKRRLEDEMKGKYALPKELKLLEEGEEDVRAAKVEWEKGRREVRDGKRRRLGGEGLGMGAPARKSGSSSSANGVSCKMEAVSMLRARILGNTVRQSAPRPRTKDPAVVMRNH